jgi:hypothetical protein
MIDYNNRNKEVKVRNFIYLKHISSRKHILKPTTLYYSSVDFFHLGVSVVVIVDLIERGEVVVAGALFLENAEAELNHSVDAGGKGRGVLKRETGGQKRCLVHQPDEVLDSLVAHVNLSLVSKFLNDLVLGVDFHGLLGEHVAGHGVVTEGLGLHDTLHVGGPAVLGGNENAGGLIDTGGNNNLLDLVAKDILHKLAKGFEAGLLFLLLLLLILSVVEVKTFLGAGNKLLTVVLFELLDHVLIDGVNQVEHFESALSETFEEGRSGNGGLRLTSDVVNTGLAVLHAGNVVLEGDLVLARLAGGETEKVSDLGAVSGIFVDAELEVLGVLFIELLVIFLVFHELGEHVKAVLNNVLLDDLKDLVLLEGLTGDVKGEILRVYYTLDEAEPLGNDFLAVVHDEDTSDVKLDVVLLLLGLEEIEGGALGKEEESGELHVSFKREVLHGKVIFPVVGESLVEVRVLFDSDILGLAHPDGLGLVKELQLVGDFLNLLGLLFLSDFFDLGLIVVFLFVVLLIVVLLLSLIVGVSDLLIGGLLNLERDGEGDELGVLLDEILKAALFKELGHVFLHVEDNLGSTGDHVGAIGDNSESAGGVGLPAVLLIIVVLGDDNNFVSNQVGGVETNTELTDHANISTS